MGYNAPTNDPLDVLRRRQEDAARKSREALTAGGTQPFQAVRKLQAQVAALQVVVERLDAQQQRLTEQQQALDGQQQKLAAQVERIDKQQDQLEVLIQNQIKTDAGSASASGVTVGGSWGGFAVVRFTVPAGYTRAIVTGHSAGAFASPQPVQMATRIAGADGQSMNFYPGAGFVNGATNYARTVDVTPGSTVSVETRALASGGAATAYLTTTATVVFEH